MKRNVNTLIKYLFLIVAAFVSIFPFYWMIAESDEYIESDCCWKTHTRKSADHEPQQLFSNYNVSLIMWNSIKISVITVLFSLLITSLAAFGFEKFRTRSSEMIYSLFLLCMMIPLAALVIPLFKMMSGLHLVNQHIAVILPLVNNLFLIFFFRQNFKSFPDGILDASRIEGASEYTIFFRIVFPMMRSIMQQRLSMLYELME